MRINSSGLNWKMLTCSLIAVNLAVALANVEIERGFTGCGHLWAFYSDNDEPTSKT
jgi:hypothetical protein